jgi:hypothetical protein
MRSGGCIRTFWWHNSAMRRLMLALVVAVGCTGCLRSTTVIDLKADGSGTIVQETGVTAQALAMIKGFAGNAGGNQANGAPPELFGEEQAKKMAAAMGVTFVSGEPLKSGDLEGYRARFSFDDISKVKLNMEQSTASGGGESKEPPFKFALDRGAASSTLTIQMPDETPLSKGPLALPGAGASGADKAQAEQAMAMMKMMMRGLFVDVSMNVDGRIVKTNASHVDGSHVTLLQIDFDKLLQDEGAMAKLQAATDLHSLASIPGLKIVSEPKVTIEFAR